MKFANIPDEILDLALGEAYNRAKGWYKWTLRSELEDVGEDILNASWQASLTKPVTIICFTAWTENHILELVYGPLGDQSILKVPLKPPPTKEIE